MQKKDAEKRFEKDIREHELLIYKVCRIYTSSEADGKDLFQEIVIQLWNSYPKYNGQAKFSTWLYRVAINTAITGLRKQKNFITSYEPSTLNANISDENYYEDEEEKLKQLYAAIEQLSQVEKAIVMLYMEEKPYDEMEEILGISQGNLRVKMNRIKEKLRELTKKN